MFAAPAGSDADGRCRPLNHVAKADVLIADETRKAHAVRLAFMLVDLTILCLFCVHSVHLLSYVVIRSWYAAQASNKGGTTVVLRCVETWVRANFTSVAVAVGNCDHKSAMAPVTKGTATLVPPNVMRPPSAPRLVTSSPGAPSPRLPIEPPRFDCWIGRPRRSYATTGMTQGWRVIAELPMAP